MNYTVFGKDKVVRDPIHKYIYVSYEIVWKAIDSREFQRLRRIHQLGGDFQVYPTAEHSRFSHSLGVYEIVRRMVEEVEGLKETLSEQEIVSVLLAALLHDLGHGPFSHALEAMCKQSHEAYTVDILQGDTHIHEVLSSASDTLVHDVCAILQGTHPNPLCTQLISGQLDADRMDYLLRDSYMTGTTYGSFDLERILRVLCIYEGNLVVKKSGVHAVEDYVMSRYQMYSQLYHHPTARSFELILYQYTKRLRTLYQEDKLNIERYSMMKDFIKEDTFTYHSLIDMDEVTFLYGVKLAQDDDDAILSDLAKRLLHRKLFVYEGKEGVPKSLKKELEEAGYPISYYYIEDALLQVPYRRIEEKELYVLLSEDELQPLSTVSTVVKAVSTAKYDAKHYIFYPRMNGGIYEK